MVEAALVENIMIVFVQIQVDGSCAGVLLGEDSRIGYRRTLCCSRARRQS